ncbi:MAG TPA: phosphoribosylamine--glycine ligase [Candidatus Acidoferrales bacterium]|nr:phosphoribosylamine--glycine ligase [Candidatus Acidoferrales bacterium]
MKILVIGSGGREHALVWKLRQSAAVEKVWCAPGNGGISKDADCVALDLNDLKAAADLAGKLGADLTIVGPELPLTHGIADEFAKRGLALLGPPRKAAQLEGSKVFAKKFMERFRIPTASTYGIYDSPIDAYTSLCSVDWPLVVKADGLCAGKGVLVTSSPDEAAAFIDRVMEKNEFGDAGKQVLFEEGLAGRELSYIILMDGQNFVSLAPTRDHKRAFDNDQGPNTGGMGAFSSADILPRELEIKILETIVRPTLAGLQKEGLNYCGFLYFGLMLTSDGPKVLEYNCRLGDPETQAILLRADFDFADACSQAASGNLAAVQAKFSDGASICVVVASEGYPEKPNIGKEIIGLEAAASVAGATIFHAGTRREGEKFYTTGGRILSVGAVGNDLSAAARIAYEAASKIRIDGAHYRKDIGIPRSPSKATAEGQNA